MKAETLDRILDAIGRRMNGAYDDARSIRFDDVEQHEFRAMRLGQASGLQDALNIIEDWRAYERETDEE